MTADDQFTIWNKDGITEIKFKGAFDVRQISAESIHILIDPWYEDSAVWEFNVYTHEFKMVRPFNEFRGRDFNDRYTEAVTW